MYVLVSDEIAERIGGNVMGKRFEIDDAPGQALTIGGVFKKLPDNTEQSYDIIVSLSSISKFMWDGTHMLTGNDRYQSFVKVSPGTTEAQLEAGMRQMIFILITSCRLHCKHERRSHLQYRDPRCGSGTPEQRCHQPDRDHYG